MSVDENVKYGSAVNYANIFREREALRVFLRESGLVLVSDKPLCYGVLLTDDSIDYSAPWPGACHDHINDMLMNDETHERYKGARVIPIYTTATPPPKESSNGQ